MGWWSIIACCVVAISSAASQEREDGILYDHTAVGIRPWYDPEIMRNNGFPNSAPYDLVQTWRWVGVQQPGEHVAIKIICKKIFIPQQPGSNDCGDYALTITDGDDTQELCGNVGAFKLLSSTNDIKFEMHTGPIGGGIVDCTAQAVPVTANRVEITTTTTTTTTTPKPTRPAFLTLESYELDSSEDGGEQGEKDTTCPCGWANKLSLRIVNGTETARNEFPFAAGLVYRGTRGRFCGATIITQYHALTAAHCTDKKPAEYLSIIVGIHNVNEDFDGPADEIPVETVINHKEYKKGIWKNDISLLVLKRAIKFSQFVGPACMPPASPKLDLDSQYIKIIGWGANEFQGAQSLVLKKVNVRVVPMKECKFMYNHISVNNPTQICTYANKKASCQGDSGGPVMWVDPDTNRYTHVGIVSFGRICGDISPSVHTSVQAYLSWINHYIRASNKPGARTCSKMN